MTTRCTVCLNGQVSEIDAALAAGQSIRATASRFGVSRASLARHRRHSGAVPAEVPERDQFAEATRLLDRAVTPRERLRGLEAVRSALKLELRDFARARSAVRSPDSEQLERLESNVSSAWAAFEDVAGGNLDTALRALAGRAGGRRRAA
jgi:microcompartment protein CcmL/EutN